MKRFFLIPLLMMLIALVGCTCSLRGSASMPTKAPSAKPSASAVPAVTAMPTQSAAPEVTAAPVMPTESIASPSATAAAGN